MKKLIVYLVFATFVVSCESENENKEKTYDEKIKEVCNCFSKENPSECFKLQHDLSLTVGEDKVKFIQATNECAN